MIEYSVSVELIKWPIKFAGFTLSRCARDPFDGVHITDTDRKRKRKLISIFCDHGLKMSYRLLGNMRKEVPLMLEKPIALSFGVFNNVLTWRRIFYVRETSDDESDCDIAWHQSFRIPSVVQTEASILTVPEVSFPTPSKSSTIRKSLLFLHLFLVRQWS
jgi:hypothetical protein